MSFKLVKDIIDLMYEVGVRTFVLTGGEPTLHKNFFDIIDYLQKKGGTKQCLLTNGYLFADNNFVNNVQQYNLKMISVSIKAANKKQYLELTQTDAYDGMEKALFNLSRMCNTNITYTITITKENLNNIEELVSLISSIDPNKDINLHFCSAVFNEQKNIEEGSACEPKELVNVLVNKFDNLLNLSNGRVYIEQTLPQCFWPPSFLQKWKNVRLITGKCHFRKRSGVIFDVNGNVIPCNNFWCFPIGQYGKNFENKDEFEKFWTQKEIINLHNKVLKPPFERCEKCKAFLKCRGGCPIQWLAKS